MLAAVTPLPVIGVPVPLKHLDGMDSLLSIVQMPAGVPVATVAVGNARNAGLLAVRILAASDAGAAAADARLPGRAAGHRPGEGRRPCAQARSARSASDPERRLRPPRRLDVARCLALLGMVATHVLDSHRPTATWRSPRRWPGAARPPCSPSWPGRTPRDLMTGRPATSARRDPAPAAPRARAGRDRAGIAGAGRKAFTATLAGPARSWPRPASAAVLHGGHVDAAPAGRRRGPRLVDGRRRSARWSPVQADLGAHRDLRPRPPGCSTRRSAAARSLDLGVYADLARPWTSSAPRTASSPPARATPTAPTRR